MVYHMSAHFFRFRSVWEVPTSLQMAWQKIVRVTEYPTWWPGVEKVTVVADGHGPLTVGFTVAYTIRSPLYTLHYQTELTEFKTGEYILARVTGDLVGQGKWTFFEEATSTRAQFEWNVAVTPFLLKLAAWWPPGRLAMWYFHNRLMKHGERGLKALLADHIAALGMKS